MSVPTVAVSTAKATGVVTAHSILTDAVDLEGGQGSEDDDGDGDASEVADNKEEEDDETDE